MDIKLLSSTGIPPTMDIEVINGIARWIKGEEEELQQAQLATYKQLGSTPQLPDDGTDWLGFFTGNVSFGEIDSQIRENIKNSKGDNHIPEYEIINNKLSVTVKKEKQK